MTPCSYWWPQVTLSRSHQPLWLWNFFSVTRVGSFSCLHSFCLASDSNSFTHLSWQNVHSFVYWWTSSFLRSHEALGNSIARKYGSTNIRLTNNQLYTLQLFVGLCVYTATFCFNTEWRVAFLKAFSKVSLSSTQEVPTCACNSVEVVVIWTVLTNFCLYYVSVLYSYAKRFHHPPRLPITGWL